MNRPSRCRTRIRRRPPWSEDFDAIRWLPGCLIALLFIIAGCDVVPPATRSPSERIEDVRALEALFPEFEELKLEAYRRDEHCEYIVYRRGAFSTAPDGSSCNVFTNTPVDFDAQARAVYDRLTSGLSMAHVTVDSVDEVTYSTPGRLTTATFDFGSNAFVSQGYVFDVRGNYNKSEEGGATYTTIDDDWYMVVDPSR